MSKSQKVIWPILISFVFGVIITMAEPDLQVLAEPVPSIPNMVIILSVAAGVGIFMMLAIARMFFRIPLNLLLFVFYRYCIFCRSLYPFFFYPGVL
ncbi:MAG: DUF1538 family protein [Lachnospiraceae bacterium]|nr:DUF1538 family protein [Lachnospiraceae bacterium]